MGEKAFKRGDVWGDRLSKKQQAFVDEYVVDCNATQAALRAGYSKKTAFAIGAENLRKPKIKKAIEKLMSAKKAERVASADEVLNFLTSVMRGEVKDVSLVGSGQGAQDVVDTRTSNKDRVRAAELLGKRHMLFTDKVDLGTTDINIVIGKEAKQDGDKN